MAFVYDASIVDSIPSLEDAHSSIASNPLFKQFLSEFRDVATHYKHNDKYGLTLVHRHTTIGPQQRLMDFGRTLQTIHLDQKAQALHGYPISPKSLALRDASWKPYEYELGNYELPDPAFLTKAKELVERFSLTGVGLRRYSPDDPEELEITESGGISVKIPWKSVSQY